MINMKLAPACGAFLFVAMTTLVALQGYEMGLGIFSATYSIAVAAWALLGPVIGAYLWRYHRFWSVVAFAISALCWPIHIINSLDAWLRVGGSATTSSKWGDIVVPIALNIMVPMFFFLWEYGPLSPRLYALWEQE